MMLKSRQTFNIIFRIFFVLFIASTAFAQQEQQSDSALPQSQFMQIIDRIDKVEDNMRDHVDKKIGELDKKIDANYKELNTKFHELDKKVAVLRSDVDKLFTIIVTIAVAVGAHLLIFIGSHIYSYWRNKTNVVPNVPLTKGEIGQYFESISDLDTVIRLEPDDYTTYNNRGADKVRLGHYNAAISDFDEAIRLNSEKADLYFNRGFAKKKLGRITDAKQDFQKALSLAQEAGDEELIATIKKFI
jgi:tetratricopeptide (TPR) repeat protein